MYIPPCVRLSMSGFPLRMAMAANSGLVAGLERRVTAEAVRSARRCSLLTEPVMTRMADSVRDDQAFCGGDSVVTISGKV